MDKYRKDSTKDPQPSYAEKPTKAGEKSLARSTPEKKVESFSEKLSRLTSGRLKITKPPFKGISF